MGVHCQVILVNTYYYPGDTLTGNIIVTSDSDRKVKGEVNQLVDQSEEG